MSGQRGKVRKLEKKKEKGGREERTGGDGKKTRGKERDSKQKMKNQMSSN